jgi:hypothetical protein
MKHECLDGKTYMIKTIEEKANNDKMRKIHLLKEASFRNI